MGKKSLFSVENQDEVKITKKDYDKIEVAQFYFDSRTQIYGVIIIALLALTFGVVTSFLLLFSSLASIFVIILVIVIWIAVLALIVYSIIFFVKERKKPKVALYYLKQEKEFQLYDEKKEDYINVKNTDIKITYQTQPLYPNTSLIKARPKKAFSAKIVVVANENTYNLMIADLFTTKEILANLDSN